VAKPKLKDVKYCAKDCNEAFKVEGEHYCSMKFHKILDTAKLKVGTECIWYRKKKY